MGAICVGALPAATLVTVCFSASDLISPNTEELFAKFALTDALPEGAVPTSDGTRMPPNTWWLWCRRGRHHSGASEDAVKEHNLRPKAVIVDSEWAALDPSVMGLGPVYCSTALMKRHQLGLS